MPLQSASRSIVAILARHSLNARFFSSERQRTIVQSFKTGLPDLTKGIDPPKRDTKPSSDTTKNARPPKGWYEVAESDYSDNATRFVAKHEQRLEEIRCSYVSSFQTLNTTSTEGDVVVAAAVHLWVPIEAALEPFQVQVQELGQNLHSESQRSQSNARSDLLLALRAGSEDKIIAVVEFKNRGHVKHSRRDFLAARLDAKQPTKPLLRSNAEVLSKQATAYAQIYQTKFVALFDWDAMFLWKFDQMSPGSLDGTTGHFAGDSGRGCYCDDAQTMPAVMLGFLLEALRDAGVKDP